MPKEIINIITEELKQKLPPSRVITDTDLMEKYSVDETTDLSAFPDLVVRAYTTEDVSNTLKICNEYSIPVTARGAGTGVTGGAVPIKGGVVLSLEKMNRILEIDTENMVALVEPGAITADIQKAVLEHGLMYPPDPASIETCSIGGNVAENSGGPRAVKYGVTKDYILGLEIVLPDGSIIKTGGKIVKNVTGFNLTGIILGSEGTLAVITKIYLKLIPAPLITKDLLIPFDSLEEAIDAVHTILSNRVIPCTIEFMEKDALKIVSEYLSSDIPFPDAGAHLLIQIDGNSEEAVFRDMEKIAEVINVMPDKILAAESSMQREKLWKARRSMRDAIKSISPDSTGEDCVVPRSKIPVFLKDAKEYLNSIGVRSIFFGHAGDGNVHLNVLREKMEYENWKKILPEIKKELYTRAINYGGTITGEHGIGCLKKKFLPLALSEAEIELLKRIKKAFDPKGILNPGKII